MYISMVALGQSFVCIKNGQNCRKRRKLLANIVGAVPNRLISTRQSTWGCTEESETDEFEK